MATVVFVVVVLFMVFSVSPSVGLRLPSCTYAVNVSKPQEATLSRTILLSAGALYPAPLGISYNPMSKLYLSTR
jgi:hypothetical protein